jgi:hypothetical protein
MGGLNRIPVWGYVVAAAILVVVQVAVLRWFGQPFLGASGKILFWVGNPFSPDNSQQLSDWYTFSHIIHGFLFYWLTKLCAPRLPLAARLLIAMGIEIGWEIAENTPMVINAYRKQALAVGYAGDSILNSVLDTAMMSLGFFFASRVKARYVAALAIAMELLTASQIRDGLALNILGFAGAPKVVSDWQAGYAPKVP